MISADYGQDAPQFHPTAVAARVCGLARGGLDPSQALALAEQALARDGAHPDVLLSLALAHYRAGQAEQAVKRCQEAEAADPDRAWLCWPVLALAHAKMGHAEEARRWLGQAAERHAQVSGRLAERPAGLSLEAVWPDFEILYAEAAAAPAGKP